MTDMNGDGMLDLVIGNRNEASNLILNKDSGSFSKALDLSEYMPNGVTDVTNIAAADINGDGMLDIVIGNDGLNNQVTLYDSCLDGGAKLHSRSWCFECPSFMGRDKARSGLKNYMCRECMPDYVQQVGGSELCEPNLSCFLGERKIGQDSCSTCSSGTYYNNSISRLINDTSTWDIERCVFCPNGTYASEDIPAINECFQHHGHRGQQPWPLSWILVRQVGQMPLHCLHCALGH